MQLLKINSLVKFPLFDLKEGELNPSVVWQPFEVVKNSGNWYLPIEAKEDLIKNNIVFQEVDLDI